MHQYMGHYQQLFNKKDMCKNNIKEVIHWYN
jgi:hypothetical protein